MEYVLLVCDADGTVHEFPGDCFVDCFADGSQVLRKGEDGAPERLASFLRGIKWFKCAEKEPSFRIVHCCHGGVSGKESKAIPYVLTCLSIAAICAFFYGVFHAAQIW